MEKYKCDITRKDVFGGKIIRKENRMLKFIKTAILLSLAVFTFVIGSGSVKASADVRKVWLQSVYKENGTIVVEFKLNVEDQYYTDSNAGYIYVKDTSTGNVTRYYAKSVSVENGVQLFRATYTPKSGENVKIKIAAAKPSITGKLQEYVDDNNGYWYQA